MICEILSQQIYAEFLRKRLSPFSVSQASPATFWLSELIVTESARFCIKN